MNVELYDHIKTGRFPKYFSLLFPFYFHHGLITDINPVKVLHFDRNGFYESSLEDFLIVKSKTHPMKGNGIYYVTNREKLEQEHIEERIAEMKEKNPVYETSYFNCETMITYLRSGKKYPQIYSIRHLLGLILFLVFLNKCLKKH